MKAKYKIVRFDIWCKKCKFEKLSESEEPCDECLEKGVNENSKKPVRFKKKYF